MRTRTTPATKALICLLLVTLFLYAYSQVSTVLPAFPVLSKQSEAPDSGKSTPTEDTAALHPERHVSRDATTLEFHWRITSDQRRPDGVLKRIYLVNDAFPGPTIEARSGDRLIIEVENLLDDDEGVSLHWHGLSMRGANHMDGAVGITQMPIAAGTSFVYNFTIEDTQHGTFWWHAHDGVQRGDGLYGGLVVHEPRNNHQSRNLDAEHLLLIGDWYHRPAQEALTAYMHPGAYGLETVPDSLIVNGIGAFNCADAVPARPLDCVAVARETLPGLKLDVTRRNVLRVVNVGAYAGISLGIDGAHLTLITIDGGTPVMGSAAKSIGVLHPGERVSLLVEMSPKSKADTSMQVVLDDSAFKYPNTALSLIHHQPVRLSGHRKSQSKTVKAASDFFDIQTVKAQDDQHNILPPSADRTIVLYAMTQKLSRLKNEPHGFMNHTFWQPQSPPLISLARDVWNKNQLVPHIEYDPDSPIWIDVVLNNLDEEGHPFHIHGYDAWILSTYSSTFNWGSYNPFEDTMAPGGDYDITGAVKRDTIYVPRRGYAVLRLRADNPGLWMFHCHVLWHLASGMAMAFEVS